MIRILRQMYPYSCGSSPLDNTFKIIQRCLNKQSCACSSTSSANFRVGPSASWACLRLLFKRCLGVRHSLTHAQSKRLSIIIYGSSSIRAQSFKARWPRCPDLTPPLQALRCWRGYSWHRSLSRALAPCEGGWSGWSGHCLRRRRTPCAWGAQPTRPATTWHRVNMLVSEFEEMDRRSQ